MNISIGFIDYSSFLLSALERAGHYRDSQFQPRIVMLIQSTVKRNVKKIFLMFITESVNKTVAGGRSSVYGGGRPTYA